ncbi:hypothetical protein N9515_10065 [Vicingaceae bacterium]|nr:hypothetical protein [Vicingaceae bacterium]
MEQFLDLINKHGFSTVIIAALAFGFIVNYKKITGWIVATIQAAAIVRNHEETIQELKEEIAVLRAKLEEYNAILMKQTQTIARLEERIVLTAKKRVSKKKSNED